MTYKFTTVKNPWFIGFDDLFETLERTSDQQQNYPPYNIRKTSETKFYIELGVAGFTRDELNVEVAEGVLKVATAPTLPSVADELDQYIHRGLAKRAFVRKFTLAPDVVVQDVALANGVLTIELERIIPDSKKPRKFEIN